MCGILGAVPATDNFLFNGALNLLEHRGPDNTGIWFQSDEVILGHKRLSIIDTSISANQPMHLHSRYHIVFNGEIYNFSEIRKELISCGVNFQTKSDTEVLLAAFIYWHSDCLKKLNGVWSFAIWDSVEKTLFLSRDRLGEKPLFYIYDHSRIIFASEQKALLPFLETVEPSEFFHLATKYSYEYESTEHSLFSGIKRFPAGHFGIYRKNNLSINRYWSPTHDDIDVSEKFEENVEILQTLLVDSCSLRLRADVPISTGLSGGVDSSAVASAIANLKNKFSPDQQKGFRQNAFVASFPGSAIDETSQAEIVANHLNIKLNRVIIEPSTASSELEKVCFLFEDIHEVNPLPHFLLYKEMKKKGFSVTLDGHGGDELFCGYESSILHALPTVFSSKKDFNLILDCYRSVHPQNGQFRGLSPTNIGAYLIKDKIKNMLRNFKRDTSTQMAFRKSESLNKHLLNLSFETVLPTLLRNYDRYSMMNGVEIRMPLLDYRIVEFAFNIGWREKLHGGYTKSILRQAIKPWLPNKIVENKTKLGFAPPIIDWLRGPLKEYILDEINSCQFQQAKLINRQRFRKKLQNLIENKQTQQHYSAEQVWKVFSIYQWEKAFFLEKKWQLPTSKNY